MICNKLGYFHLKRLKFKEFMKYNFFNVYKTYQSFFLTLLEDTFNK